MRNIPYFDAHCDTISRRDMDSLRNYTGHLDLTRLSGFKTAGQIFAIFAPSGYFKPEEIWPVTCRQHERFVREIEANSDIAMHCRTASDAKKAFAENKVAAFLSIEGAELLNCDMNLLDEVADWGVRAINLTWNYPNAVSGTNAQETDRGLSELGRRFVKEAQKRNILMDVSHLSEPGFWDLMEITNAPVIASHSNAKALCPHSRNLTDAQIKALVENKGFAGLNVYSLFVGERADMDELIAHVERFWELGGEDVLGLGGDWDGCDSVAGGLTGIQDLPKLYEALYRRNYSEQLLHKFFSDNLLRVLG